MTNKELADNFNPRPPSGGRQGGGTAERPLGNFNPRPPSGGRPAGTRAARPPADFNPRPPSGGRRRCIRQCLCPSVQHFNPRPPSGGRPRMDEKEDNATYFNPRPPSGGRRAGCRPEDCHPHISIHVPRAGDDTVWPSPLGEAQISIHVPRAGDDFFVKLLSYRQTYFNPRPPSGGRPVLSLRLRRAKM